MVMTTVVLQLIQELVIAELSGVLFSESYSHTPQIAHRPLYHVNPPSLALLNL